MNIKKSCRLADGSSMASASARSGIPIQTLYRRVQLGLTPDEAVQEGPRARGRVPRIRLQDGSLLMDVISSAGVDPASVYRRIRRGLSPDDAMR